jgi:hypothetical protein
MEQRGGFVRTPRMRRASRQASTRETRKIANSRHFLI